MIGLAVAAGIALGAAAWLATDAAVVAWVRGGVRRARVRGGVRCTGGSALSNVVGAVAGAAPGLYGLLRGRGRDRDRARRRERCVDELPELIDVVALGLSAGISFDASLALYCERYQTMLAARLDEAMKAWQFGMATRREALEGVARDLQVAPFSTFVETLTESLEFGAPLVKSLTEQSDAVRRSRRFAVEEQIEKAPVKMLIPTGTLVLPAMLLAILGPILSSLTQVSG